MKTVTIVGAGLAGCEAALQCARRGVQVRLVEMRPAKMTEAHETGDVAEVVCSNSLKSEEPQNAHGLLKAELRLYGSALLECADRARIPGGKALVVDRRRFSAEVQKALDRAGVTVERCEVTALPGNRGAGTVPGLDDPAAKELLGAARYSPHDFPSAFEMSDPHQPIATAMPEGTVPDCAAFLRGGDCPDGQSLFVVATGPLTSAALAESLQQALGAGRLFFYDAIAPIVSAESLDRRHIFEGSRYGAGSDYLNCPMTEEEYERFVAALLEAELHPIHNFEMSGERDTDRNRGEGTVPAAQDRGAIRDSPNDFGRAQFFEGCLPVEEIARRGKLALAFGPMKPVGLEDPRTGTRPFAVVQLRRENEAGTMWNLVGFQTRLKHPEQVRVFRLIPGLERAEFLRLGSIHRNTYLDAPAVLLPTLQARARPELLVAGQLTGVEGYVESIGAGLVAGVNAARLARGEAPIELPADTMLGGLLRYITGGPENLGGPENRDCTGSRPRHSGRGLSQVFQPMNANFGLLPPLPKRMRGRDKRAALAERALEAAGRLALTIMR